MKTQKFNIPGASFAELVNFYNLHADKPVRRFSTRAMAEKRVTALIAAMPQPKEQTAKTDARSAAIAATWANKKVAAARSTRSHVVVKGVEYSSVKEAFVALDLPLQKHIPFRMTLKAAGRASFGGFQFKLA